MIIKYLHWLSFLRSITRKLGLNHFFFKLFFNRNSYEEHFNKSFSDLLFLNYCVYDIGANIGHYSNKFSNIVGDNGIIVAFEPSSINF